MNKKHIAVNTHLLLCVLMCAEFLWLCILCAGEKEIALSVLFGVFALVPVVVFFLSPLYVTFSADCIEIVYHFGLKERIRWSEIRNISVRGSWIGKGGGLPNYEIAYPCKEQRPFFVVGKIPKTRKTKRYIERYYKRNIEDLRG